MLHRSFFLLVFIFFPGTNARAQDSTANFFIDTKLLYQSYHLPDSFSISFQPSLGSISHSPQKKDHKNYKRYSYLLERRPDKKNYMKYYDLAVSLWELEKTAEAAKMFLTIIGSGEDFYTSSYHYSSDIRGDTTTNIYGYGSFTTNYKNYAAKYLSKIYLEQQQYDTALAYLEDAVKKYPVTYTCGTGYNMQQDEYRFLYASCYQGQHDYKKIIDLLLPGCLERNDDMIITAIKKTWPEKAIQDSLLMAERSIICTLDSIPSYYYQTTEASGKEPERTDTIEFYSGSATMMLFNQQIDLSIPLLLQGERLTKERVIRIFKESDFYRELKQEDDLLEDSIKISVK